MMNGILKGVACLLACSAGRVEAGTYPAEAGSDSVEVRLVLGEMSRSLSLSLVTEGADKPARLDFLPHHQRDEHVFVPYGNRGPLTAAGKLPPTDIHTNALLRISGERGWFGLEYGILPYFDQSTGIYEHSDVVARRERWAKEYLPIESRELVFRFERNRDRGETEAFLDGQYCGIVPRKGRIVAVTTSLPDKARVACRWYAAAKPSNRYELPSLPHRARPCVAKDARLTLREGLPVKAWPLERTFDSSLHRMTTYRGNFGWNPFYARQPFEEDIDYAHWTVPPTKWATAWILCADIPEEGKVPVVGTRLTIFGQVNSAGVSDNLTDLSTAPTNKTIRTVGRLTYRKDGKTRETPVYLVRQKLDVGRILTLWNDKPIWGFEGWGVGHRFARKLRNLKGHFDFEFIGAGSDRRHRPASSVQILGCALESSPFSFDVSESERGNIFADDEKPETGWELEALVDRPSGSIRYTITDDSFKVLRRSKVDFTLGPKGDKRRISIDLSMPEVGWYGLEFEICDGEGRELARHAGAFTILGKNDREAGFESPYACWPQGTDYAQNRKGEWGFHSLGRHGSNPNRDEIAEIMHKAGYHSSWTVPVSNETERADWKLTLSAHRHYSRPRIPWPAGGPFKPWSPKQVEAADRLVDEAVRFYREEQTRYPHCRTIQILHENGGQDLSEYVSGKLKPVRGTYRGAEGPAIVYWCTELARRFRKEFPECRLSIGNGSSSSQMIGYLCAAGFDLDLIDDLGIESKGFSTMPELATNREAPGMLWALRETGRVFGYTNFQLTASNEYVFRPERPWDVSRTATPWRRMQVTNFSLRDYILSLAWGCRTISTGHIEDCFSSYYESNWGAGGQCTFFPYSYPKRVFTALAQFTKVFDCATFSRRIPTGALSAYALEFRRNRRLPDYASAWWTPQFAAKVEVKPRAGLSVRIVDWQGRERKPQIGAKGTFELAIGPTPVYLVSSAPIVSARFLPAVLSSVPEGAALLLDPGRAGGAEMTKLPQLKNGDHKALVAEDSVLDRKVVELSLDRSTPAKRVLASDFGIARLKKGIVVDLDKYESIGMWIRGDSSFAEVRLVGNDLGAARGTRVTLPVGYRGLVTFEGWQFVETSLHRTFDGQPMNLPKKFSLYDLNFTVPRNQLDPMEMRPTEGRLAFGPIYAMPRKGARLDYVADGMENVDAKDL